MKIKDFLELDIVELAKIYDNKEKAATKKVEPKTTESTEVVEKEGAPTKYKGCGNPMQLRKMLKDRGIETPAVQKATYYVAELLKADAEGNTKAEVKPVMNKPAANKGKKLTEETYDKNETYTAEQLDAVTGRGLENICRKVFDIPRSQIVPEGKTAANKELCIKAILAAQGGGAPATEAAGKYDSMKDRELYNECKGRGINVPAKKTVKFYIDVLEANDRDKEKEAKKKEVEEAIALFKECKKNGIKIAKGLSKKEYEEALKEVLEIEDDEDDWAEDEEVFDEVEEDTEEDEVEDWDL